MSCGYWLFYVYTLCGGISEFSAALYGQNHLQMNCSCGCV